MGNFNMLEAMGKRTAGMTAPRIAMIDIDKLEPSTKNFYRVQEDPAIEKQNERTKAEIEMFGVLQPLRVREIEDGKYRITTGERRFLACRRLAEEGKEEFRKIPCIIKTALSEEDEQMELIITNDYREKTLPEKMEEVKQLSALLEIKKSRGEKIPGKLNEIIAEMLNISKSEVGRLRQIDKNLDPEIKEALNDGKIAMTTALEMSKLSPEEQKAVYEAAGGDIKAKDVKAYQEPPRAENGLIDGFEPMPKPKKENTAEKPPAKENTGGQYSYKGYAIKAAIGILDKQINHTEALKKIDIDEGNVEGAESRAALADYLNELKGRAEKELFTLSGQDMFE